MTTIDKLLNCIIIIIFSSFFYFTQKHISTIPASIKKFPQVIANCTNKTNSIKCRKRLNNSILFTIPRMSRNLFSMLIYQCRLWFNHSNFSLFFLFWFVRAFYTLSLKILFHFIGKTHFKSVYRLFITWWFTIAWHHFRIESVNWMNFQASSCVYRFFFLLFLLSSFRFFLLLLLAAIGKTNAKHQFKQNQRPNALQKYDDNTMREWITFG